MVDIKIIILNNLVLLFFKIIHKEIKKLTRNEPIFELINIENIKEIIVKVK